MRKLAAVCLALSLSCLPLVSQSSSIDGASLLSLPEFDSSFVYQVPGEVLNRWLAESKAQEQALLSADADCERALKLASESLTSFGTYRSSILQARILEVAVALFVGWAIGSAVGASK